MTTPVEPPLVGREGELAQLDGLLEALERGSTQIVVVTGEPGIGKSRLLAQLAGRAEARGCLVLQGRGGEFERELPFGVIVDTCDDYLASLDARTVERLAGEGLIELTTIFPSLQSLAPVDRRPALVDERYRAHRAVSGMLSALALRHPVVLVLDDLHWSDDASAELLGHLVRRRPDGPVALALSYRTGQAPRRLADALRAADWAELELRPLTLDEATHLLGDLDTPLRAALYEESGGNPFYLQQLARARVGPAASDAARRSTLDGGTDVPSAVTVAIGRELDELSPETRLTMEAAAVAGDPFEPDIAADIAESSEAQALEAIDEALGPGLLRPTSVPRRFAFRHPIIRRVVYEGASPAWRLGAHARAAAALEARGASAAERAHHVEQSAQRGDEHSIELLCAAGDALATRAPGSAVRWFGAALRLLPTGDRRRVDLLASLAHALAATGRLDESRAMVLELLELLPAEATQMRVRATTRCASIEHLLGHHAQAHARLRAALEGLRDDHSPEAAKLMIELGVDAFYICCSSEGAAPAGEFGAMREWAARARAIALELADPALAVAATGLMSWASAMAGAGDATLRHCNEAASRMSQLADDQFDERIDGLVYLAWAEYLIGRYHESLAHVERGIAVSQASADGRFLLQLREGQANNLAALGRVAEALAASEAAVESARLSGTRQGLAWSLGSMCRCATFAGDLARARRAGEEALDLAGSLDFSVLTIGVAFDLAACLVEAGEPERAIEVALTAAGGSTLPNEPAARLAFDCEILARAYVGAGRQREAELAAARAGEAADRLGWVVTRMQADRARAVALFGAGEWSAATAAALESAAAADGIAARLDHARALLLAGRAFAAAGAEPRAKTELRKAEQLLHDCGALRWRGEAVRELRKLGVRVEPHRAGGATGHDGVDSLTAREREIAELVWDRKTNPEIAGELFLSPKTVETHLRNIFRKLDASSRVEVARAIERARRAD